MENQYIQRAWRDLDAAEEKQRRLIVNDYKNLQKVMIELAHALRGEAMERARSESSDAPLSWTDKEWRKFWFADRQIVHKNTITCWESIAPEAAQDDPAVLGMPRYNMLDVYRTLQEASSVKNQKEALVQIHETHRRELERKNIQIANLTMHLHTAERLLAERDDDNPTNPSANTTKDVKIKMGTTKSPVAAPQASCINAVPTAMFKNELAVWANTPVTDKLPDSWSSKYGGSQTEARIAKVYQALFAIYTLGINCRNEVEWLLSAISGVSVKNRSTKRCLHELKQEGIIQEHPFLFAEADFPTGITFYSLTDKGESLCKDWKLSKRETLSEFAKAIKNGVDLGLPRIQLTLAFSFYAHIRGLDFKLFPEDGTDLLVTEGNEVHSVIVVPFRSTNKEIQEEVTELHGRGKKVGFVTISSERGKKIAAWCKKNYLPASYTDFYHLVNKTPGGKTITPFTLEDYTGVLPLWVEKWD
jgi:hypothetical protein